MKSTGVRALVYAHANMNLIDGSAIWVQSAVQVFAAAGCDVTLVLKASVLTDRLLEPLLKNERVTIRRPYEERLVRGVRTDPPSMTHDQAIAVIRKIDQEKPHDVLVVRGLDGGPIARRGWRLRQPALDVPDRHPPDVRRRKSGRHRRPGTDRGSVPVSPVPDRGAPFVPRNLCPAGLRAHHVVPTRRSRAGIRPRGTGAGAGRSPSGSCTWASTRRTG